MNDLTDDVFEKYSFDQDFDFNMTSGEDGLSVIERRIIYEMMKRKNTDSFQKCSDIVLAVLKKMRNNIDDFICKMGEEDGLRYPLFNTHGNFGYGLYGEPGALPCYREMELNFIGKQFKVNQYKSAQFIENDWELGLSKENADLFVKNHKEYQKKFAEPLWLDSDFPYLLCNGTYDLHEYFGEKRNPETIIPSHNINDVSNSIKAYLRNESISDDELIDIINGPDFPNGGIVGRKGLEQIYKTGEGKLTVKGKYRCEGRAFIIQELPYHVLPSEFYCQLKENLSEFYSKFDDYSMSKLKMEIRLKKNVQPEDFLRALEEKTYFKKEYNVQNKVLINQEPKIVNLRQMIELYVNQRCKVLKGTKEEKYQKIEKGLDNLCKKIGDSRRSEIADF